MADGAGVAEDLVVVATGEGLVAEEVDGLVLDATVLGLGLEVLEAVCLVPASGEDVEGDLATDGEAAGGGKLVSLWANTEEGMAIASGETRT